MSKEWRAPFAEYRIRARDAPFRVTRHEQHAHHRKHKAITQRTIAIIARSFGG
jgi:hypothetical protein